MKYVGLKNTKKSKRYVHGNTVSALIAAAKQPGCAGGTADDNGAIAVWIDDDGYYRADRQVFMSRKASIVTKKLTELRAFLKNELPKIA